MPQINPSNPLTGPAGRAAIVKPGRNAEAARERYNPLRGLTFERAISLIQSYRAGEFADLQWTYSHLEESDPDLLTIVDRRMASIVEMDWNIKLPPEDRRSRDFDDHLAQEQQAYLRESYDRIDNLYQAVGHLALATFRGFSHVEIQQLRHDHIDHLELVDQWNILRDGYTGRWKYNAEAIQTSFDELPNTLLIPEDRFLIRVVRRHIDRVALLKAVRCNLGEKDWTAFLEVYGLPSGIVTLPPNIPSGREREFERAAVSISEGSSGALPHGSTYTPNDTARGLNPFADYLAYFTRKLVLVGTGGLLTMLTQSGSGTLAGSAHMEAFKTLARAEGRQISECFQRTLDRYLLNQQFPNQPHLAYWALDTQTGTSTTEIIKHVCKLSAVGYKIPHDHVSEKTGYPVTLAPRPAPLAAHPIANRAHGPRRPSREFTPQDFEQLGISFRSSPNPSK